MVRRRARARGAAVFLLRCGAPADRSPPAAAAACREPPRPDQRRLAAKEFNVRVLRDSDGVVVGQLAVARATDMTAVEVCAGGARSLSLSRARADGDV